MNIVFITHRFFPESSGGSQVYTRNIARALGRLGHSVSILYAPVWDMPQRQKPYQVTVEDAIYEDFPVRKLRFDWRSAPDPHGYIYYHNPVIHQHIVEFLSEQSADIVHITACLNVTSAAITAPRSLGIPVVPTLTQDWMICPRSTLMGEKGLCAGRQDGWTCLHCLYGSTRTYRVLSHMPLALRSTIICTAKRFPRSFSWNSSLNLISAVERRNKGLSRILAEVGQLIAPSRFIADIIASTGIVEPERILYSPHGHDVAGASLGSEKSPSPVLRFGFTGNLLPIKGVHHLIQAFNRLGSDVRAALLIYGSSSNSEYMRYLRELAGSNPFIEFRGRFDNADIGKVLQNIDVVVVPSVCFENAPVTIAEAYAARTPVIATNHGGMAEAVQHRITGFLFRPNDIDDLSRQMRVCLEHPELLAEMRSRIPPVRTVDDEAEALERLYSRLILPR